MIATPSVALLRIGILIICICGTASSQTFWQRPDVPFNSGGAPVAVNSKGDIFIGTGATLARSTDAGLTWEHSLIGASVNHIMAVDVSRDDDIYVCTLTTGIFRSTDDGDTWSKLESWPKNASLAVSLVVSRDRNIFVGTTNGSLYRSIDEGMSWEIVQAWGTAIEMTVAPNGDIFVVEPWWDEKRELSYSTDEGDHWLARDTPLPDSLISMRVAPDGALLVCTRGLYRSTDAGESWKLLGLADMKVADVIVGSGGVIIALTKDQGIFRSTDDGVTWARPAAGIPGESFYEFIRVTPPMLAVTPSGVIFSGSSSEGLIRSADNGETWEVVHTELGSYQASSIQRDPSSGYLYARVSRYLQTTYTSSSPLLRSTDQGEHWEVIFSDLAGAPVMVGDGRMFLPAGEKIYRSTDHGENWTLVSRDLPQEAGNFVHIALPAPGNLIAVFADGSVYQSTDGGENWRHQGGNGPKALITANTRNVIVAVNGMRSTDNGVTWSAGAGFPSLVREVVAAPNGDFYLPHPSNIYRSTDDGANWVAYPGHLPKRPSNSPVSPRKIAIAPDGRLILGTTTGTVHIYNSAENRWDNYGEPIPVPSEITALVPLPGGGMMVGTPSAGMFRANMGAAVESPADKPAGEGMFLGALPQPASGVATIRFQLQSAGNIRLTLFDMMGRPVATLLDEPRPAGEGSAVFDAGSYPGGVYICRMTTGVGENHMMLMIAN